MKKKLHGRYQLIENDKKNDRGREEEEEQEEHEMPGLERILRPERRVAMAALPSSSRRNPIWGMVICGEDGGRIGPWYGPPLLFNAHLPTH